MGGGDTECKTPTCHQYQKAAKYWGHKVVHLKPSARYVTALVYDTTKPSDLCATNPMMICAVATLFSTIFIPLIYAELQPQEGTHCSPNQVVTKLTVYEDGAIEAECNKLPCGTSGMRCVEGQTSCKADSDIFSGMKWALNGQSVLLRCCSFHVPSKIYVGTDLVSLGSYYTGGLVDKKDLYGTDGAEYDFISNIRTEQGGVRVWVYRVMCSSKESKQQSNEHTISHMQMNEQSSGPEIAAQHDESTEQETSAATRPRNPLQYRPEPINPLQYKPANYRRLHSTASAENPTGRLL